MASANGNGRRRDAASPTRANQVTGVCSAGFVLCAGRSGSSLLRLILNSHPEIACPPETNVAAIFSAIGFSISAATEPDHAERHHPDNRHDATQRVAEICREVAEGILGGYAQARGKAMWIDKSLPSVYYGDLLAKIFPEARFICLYRQCPDTVASLQEASSWSYNNFGILPFVQASPGNLVQAFTGYWAERVALVQEFERAHPEQALRVRYEDLVDQPDEVIAEILNFLGVSDDENAKAQALAFRPDVTAAIPGDVKARFVRGIDRGSVGRGWSVPFESISPELRSRVDELSSELGYPPLPNLKQYISEPATPLISAPVSTNPSAEDVRRLLETLTTVSNGTPANREPISADSLLKLVVTDVPEPWMIDLGSGHVEQGDGEANWLALTDSSTLIDLVSGRSNPGVAMQNSTLQIASASDQARPDEFLDRVDDLMTLLRR